MRVPAPWAFFNGKVLDAVVLLFGHFFLNANVKSKLVRFLTEYYLAV